MLSFQKGKNVFELIFYKDKNGNSNIVNYLDDLQKKSKTDKNARVNREKILSYMAALAEFGTRIGEPFVKHIEDDLWELRPITNRIFFFYWKDRKFVLVHYFIKKSKKTPRKEIEKAKRNMRDYLERSEQFEKTN